MVTSKIVILWCKNERCNSLKVNNNQEISETRQLPGTQKTRNAQDNNDEPQHQKIYVVLIQLKMPYILLRSCPGCFLIIRCSN